MKKIIIYFILLFSWLLGGLIFKYDANYYSLLNIPEFALSPNLISMSWFVLYILISYSVLLVINKTNILKNNDYLYVLITNYLANMFFPLMFFSLKSPFFGFVITLIVLVSSIYLFLETKKIDKKASIYLIPYLVFNCYALIVSLSVYLMNF